MNKQGRARRFNSSYKELLVLVDFVDSSNALSYTKFAVLKKQN
jgi:hypothetical protein